MTSKLILNCILTAFCLAFFAGGAQADLNLASGWPSGQWYNPARDGEGFYVEVIGEGDSLQIAVAMYSYNDQGKQLWLVGNVAIEAGDQGATVPVFSSTDARDPGRFPLDRGLWIYHDLFARNLAHLSPVVVAHP